jgi:TonB family protein
MNASLILKDLVLYSLQAGIVVGLAAFVPAALRLRLPAAKLAYWHILLAACLLAPLASPWKRQVEVMGVVGFTTAPVVDAVPAPAPPPAPPRFPFSPSQIALAVLAAGAAARLGLLAVGLVRLRGYRRRSRPLEPAPSWSTEADLRLSAEVSSPVTFGARRPVVLLPAGFPHLDSRLQEAILAHECLHVRRRDWVYMVVEELVRAVFWFHPAIWWLLSEIQLAREQAVDRAAVEMTQQREEYVDALLAIAGARPQMDLAPAPLFLRRRHLKHRVISIVEKEVRMSKTRLAGALAAAVCILAAACWMVTSAFPLQAAPQVVTDGSGVSVDVGGAAMMHRSAVTYPEAARAKGIEGIVVLQARLDAGGSVVDASVVSGPQELRRAAIEAVLQWHFMREYGGSTQQVSIEFKRPKAVGAASQAATMARIAEAPDAPDVQAVIQQMRERAQTVPPPPMDGADATRRPTFVVGGGVTAPQGGVLGSIFSGPNVVGLQPAPASASPARIRSIRVEGLPDSAKNELMASLPVREGDLLTPENNAKLQAAARQFDEHLSVGMNVSRGEDGSLQADVRIATPGAVPARIRVGGNVQGANVVKTVPPVYPPLARQARIQGKVILDAVIGKDGKVQNATAVSGHALLIQAALDAVRQWEYRPTLLNGEPVEVSTQVEVTFALPDEAPPAQP